MLLYRKQKKGNKMKPALLTTLLPILLLLKNSGSSSYWKDRFRFDGLNDGKPGMHTVMKALEDKFPSLYFYRTIDRNQTYVSFSIPSNEFTKEKMRMYQEKLKQCKNFEVIWINDPGRMAETGFTNEKDKSKVMSHLPIHKRWQGRVWESPPRVAIVKLNNIKWKKEYIDWEDVWFSSDKKWEIYHDQGVYRVYRIKDNGEKQAFLRTEALYNNVFNLKVMLTLYGCFQP